MITNINARLSLFYLNIIFIILSAFTLKVNSETKIVAKSGDTLFKLSKQYGVSLKELMHKNNFIDATEIIEGELIVIPLKNNNSNDYPSYKVVQGDTLYKIARDYKVNLKDIISLNNLSIDSYLKPNQIILLPKGSIYKKKISTENIKSIRKKVFYHKTSNTEDISTISKLHRVSIEEINNLNKLNSSVKIKPNIKLKLRENKSSKWLKYGSLMINWSDWTYFNGNYVANAKTKNNRSFFLAVSCKKRVLNNTLNNSYWTSWYFPDNDFEYKLINDFCDQDFNF
tara:strand:- start:273 stop:1124 length:852 start_codon:yes stop_codon:yes gene_type:complete